MQRIPTVPRPDWRAKVEALGLSYCALDDGRPYWDESAYYQFTPAQIDTLERATGELMDRCLEAGQWIVDNNLFPLYGFDETWAKLIRESWDADEPQFYGRFDLAYDGVNPPKLLEFNGDTPTALLEAAVVQWYWLRERFPDADQFNSLHERLVARWRELNLRGPLHFTCLADTPEDEMTVTYLRDTAMQAGLKTEFLPVEGVGLRHADGRFVDLANRPIANLFKLYPWEWLLRDPFGVELIRRPARLIEPIWKLLFSHKGILAALWHLFPEHPNLLEASLDPAKLAANGPGIVRKPLLGREGANVTIFGADGRTPRAETGGRYGEEGFLYQAFQPTPDFGGGRRATVGSWVVGGMPAGIGIREADGLIADNASRFVPHLFFP